MKPRLLLLILLFPLFFLGISGTHDWGDDFAQYLIQARNIIESRPQDQNGLIFDAAQLPYALKAYPVGFPLMLSPLFCVFGLQIQPYLIFITLLLILAAYQIFSFSKKYFDEKNALVITLLFSYSIFSLILKKEILSEWPFTLVLYAILYRLQKNSNKAYFCAGMLGGLLLSIRIAGVVILPAVFLSVLVSNLPAQQKSKRILLFVSPAVILYGLLNVAAFHLSVQELLGFYGRQWNSHSSVLSENLWELLTNTAAVICQPLHSAAWNYIVLALIVTGIVRKFSEQSAGQWFFFLYIGLIAVYPYSSSGFRFLFPIIPITIIYFAEGLLYLLLSFRKTSWHSGVLAAIAIVSIFFSIRLFSILPPADGPYSEDAREAFAWIQNNTPDSAIIAFPRARALSLYGKRNSTFLIDGLTADQNLRVFDKIRCSYILYPDERSGAFSEKLQEYMIRNKGLYETIWTNGKYVVLHRR